MLELIHLHQVRVVLVLLQQFIQKNEKSIDIIINSSPFITETRLHPQSFDLLGGGSGGTTRNGRRRAIEFGEAAATAVLVTPPPSAVRLRQKKKK